MRFNSIRNRGDAYKVRLFQLHLCREVLIYAFCGTLAAKVNLVSVFVLSFLKLFNNQYFSHLLYLSKNYSYICLPHIK